jgi:hypothetical protein
MQSNPTKKVWQIISWIDLAESLVVIATTDVNGFTRLVKSAWGAPSGIPPSGEYCFSCCVVIMVVSMELKLHLFQ